MKHFVPQWLSRIASSCSLIFSVAVIALPSHAADEAAQLALGRNLFTKVSIPACAICHTLNDAGARGEIGPVLDEIKPDASRVATALRNGPGNMPSYKATLSEEQIAALARYVAMASGAAK